MIKKILSKLTWLLAWGSWILAAVGGLSAPSTFVGDIVVGIVGIFWAWVPFALIGVGGAMILGDLLRDGIPERMAVYLTIVWPSFFLAIPKDAGLHKWMTGWMTDLNNWLDSWLGYWVGDVASNAIMTVVAVTSISVAVVWSHRYAQGAKRAAGAAAGSPSPLAARRPR